MIGDESEGGDCDEVICWLGQLLYISRCRQTCEVASFKNFDNYLTTVIVMTKTKVAPFYLGHGVVGRWQDCNTC